jgi:STE24 endopeptidase
VNEDKSVRYQRLKRRADLASLVWNAALLVAVLASGATVALRAAAQSLASGSPLLSRVAYVVVLMAILELASLPLAYYSGYLLERRYGLSTERLAAWLADQGKSFAIGAVLGSGAVSILYPLIGASPERWWIPAGFVFALIIVGIANLAPVLLLPLFYTVKPLEQEALRARLLALAERAGARVLGAYEWGLGEKTRKANAALAGLGGTRRILVSDTMLADYTDEEIEVVLAHELAHHVHGDIWKGIAFESALVLAGFYVAARLLGALAPTFGLTGPADIAGLPLLLLAAGGVSVLMVPAAYAMTRAFERSADRFALRLTENPKAFISAMRRLSAQNLAEESPSKVVEWLFHSHPPIRERIAAAEAFLP